MRNARRVEQRRPFADARRDPFEFPVRRKLAGQRPRQFAYVGARLPRKPLQLVERPVQPLRFDRLQQIVDRVDRTTRRARTGHTPS